MAHGNAHLSDGTTFIGNSTYGTATPCIQVVDAWMEYLQDLPFLWLTIDGIPHPTAYVWWPEMPAAAVSLPADDPSGDTSSTGTGGWVWLNPADFEMYLATSNYSGFSSRNVFIFKLLISCPGIWDIQNASFTYTTAIPYLPGYGETNIMTMLDIYNSFPVVVPDNEQAEVLIAWDFRADQIGFGPSGQGSAGDLVWNAFDFCIAPIMIPFLPPGIPWDDPVNIPQEDDPVGTGDVADGSGADTEADSSEESGGPPSSSEGTADESGDSSIPGGADGSDTSLPEDMPGNSADPVARHTLKAIMHTHDRPEKGHDSRTKVGLRPKYGIVNPNRVDVLSSKKPLARIAEYREAERGSATLAGGPLNLPGMVTRSAIENTPNQPGTAVISSQVFKRGAFSDIVGSRTEYLTTKVTSRALGASLTIADGRANPTRTLLNASELAGSGSLNIDAYTYKTSGKNIKEMLAKHAVKAPSKTDAHGRLLKSANRKDGNASSAPTATMELFLTNKSRNVSPEGSQVLGYRRPGYNAGPLYTKNFSRTSTEPLAPTNANQDYEVPVSGDFHIVDDSNIIYNGGAGIFYGVGPFLNFESEEVLNGIFFIVNKSVALKAYTTVNDASIVDTDLVTPASIGVVNRSRHRTEYGCLVILGILTSDQSFRWFAHNKINIRPLSYSFMNAPIPPGMPPGAARIIGMVFSSNNKLLVSSDESVIIAPDGYTVEGYTSQSPLLPGSLADLTNNPAWRYATRIYPRPGEKRRMVATTDTVDFVVKIPQIASSRGLKTKLTVVDTDLTTTGVSSSRFAIDGVEIFPGAHDCYLQFSTATGNSIDIQVTDVEDKVDCNYSYTILGSNLEHPTGLVYSGMANDLGYMGGSIQTPVIDGLVVLNNNRNNYSTMVSTNHDGYLLLNVDSGYESTSVAGQINQVIAGDTPYLGFDSLPGDGITVYAQGPGGQYNDVVLTGNLSLDSGILLPVGTYALPSLPVFPCPLGPPNMNGDIIPAGDEPPDGTPTDVPVPSDSECVVQGTNQWKAETVQICQRPSNPCLVDITTNIYMCDTLGNPMTIPSNKRYQIVYELCSFSIDPAGLEWHELVPLKTDSQHTGDEDFAIPGTYNFVADMCNHFSSFFSTGSIKLKMVFRIGVINPDGDFIPECSSLEILGS